MDVDTLNPEWLAATRGRFPPHGPRIFLGLFPIAPGGNVGMRKDAWRRVGGYDEAFSGPEDADFSLRLWLAGIDVAVGSADPEQDLAAVSSWEPNVVTQ